MKYLVRRSDSDRTVPVSLDTFKVGNLLMYVPFGDIEKKALPKFNVQNMGAPEKVSDVIELHDSKSGAEDNIVEGIRSTAANVGDHGESGSEDSSVKETVGTGTAADLIEHGSMDGFDHVVSSGSMEVLIVPSFQSHAPNVDKDVHVSVVGICGIPNTKGSMLPNAAEISTTTLKRFKDTLKPGDHVLVFGFNDDDRWVPGAVIESEGHLDTWKIKLGNKTRDITKVNVVRVPVVETSKAKPDRTKKKRSQNTNVIPNSVDSAVVDASITSDSDVPSKHPHTKKKEIIAGTAFSGKELVTKAPHEHSSVSCSTCMSSTWACPFNSVNIQTATLLRQVGLNGRVTKADGNLCLYRALHELLPENIPSIDHDEKGAKKILLDIVTKHLVRPPDMVEEDGIRLFEEAKENVLKDLKWEGKCKGLQAGYIMQPMADHFQQSFNLYTVDLVKNVLGCEQFTSMIPDGSNSEWLNIVCVPGIGQLLGGKSYDLHYIPAFKVLRRFKELADVLIPEISYSDEDANLVVDLVPVDELLPAALLPAALLPATLAGGHAMNPKVAGATLESMAAVTSHYFEVEALTEVASQAHSLTSQVHFTFITQATTIPLQHASPLEAVVAPGSLVHSSAKPEVPELPEISAKNEVYD